MFGLFRKKDPPAPAAAADERTQSLERIVPLVKAVVHDSTGTREIELPEAELPIMRPLAADLVVMYVEDLPSHFQFVSARRMEELGLTRDTLHELALRNLPSRLPKIELHGESPRFMLTCGGNFEATLLLHGDLWGSIADRLPGEPMVTVPARDLLFVSGADWEGARAFLSELAQKDLPEKRYALSQHVFRRKGGVWVAADMDS